MTNTDDVMCYCDVIARPCVEFHVVVVVIASRDRQCCVVVDVKNTVHLFNASKLEKKWPSRIFTVLGVQVDERLSLVDGLDS